jgi:hyperosmotically inducible periplasmic protein
LNRLAICLFLSSSILTLGSVAIAQNSTPVPPDNSGINVRDRAPAALTAGEQSNTRADEELTREIRRALVKDDSLSMMAHNVKIITVDGNVTLRGPVETTAEKTTVARVARSIAGTDRVENKIEVKGKE